MAAITDCARSLTAAKGLDGFTMDELAECVGVSRRTLFNYVPSKLDAVVGPKPSHQPELFEVFLSGGPTGDVLTDLKFTAIQALATKPLALAEAEQFRQLVRQDPRLFALLHERFAEVAEFLTEAINQRQGAPVDPLHGEILLKLLLGMFDTALDQALADPSVDFEDHFERVFGIVSDLVHGARQL